MALSLTKKGLTKMTTITKTPARYNRISVQLPDATLASLNVLAAKLTIKPGTLARQLIIDALAKRAKAKVSGNL